MIVLGVLALIVGVTAGLRVVEVAGWVLLVVGLATLFVGTVTGSPVFGYWWI